MHVHVSPVTARRAVISKAYPNRRLLVVQPQLTPIDPVIVSDAPVLRVDSPSLPGSALASSTQQARPATQVASPLRALQSIADEWTVSSDVDIDGAVDAAQYQSTYRRSPSSADSTWAEPAPTTAAVQAARAYATSLVDNVVDDNPGNVTEFRLTEVAEQSHAASSSSGTFFPSRALMLARLRTLQLQLQAPQQQQQQHTSSHAAPRYYYTVTGGRISKLSVGNGKARHEVFPLVKHVPSSEQVAAQQESLNTLHDTTPQQQLQDRPADADEVALHPPSRQQPAAVHDDDQDTWMLMPSQLTPTPAPAVPAAVTPATAALSATSPAASANQAAAELGMLHDSRLAESPARTNSTSQHDDDDDPWLLGPLSSSAAASHAPDRTASSAKEKQLVANRKQHSQQQHLQQQQQQQQPALDVTYGLTLTAFVYCVGQADISRCIWQLGWPQHCLQYVSRPQDADVIIHKKPTAAGEKHFHYEEYRQQAGAKGIPFVDLNAITPQEVSSALSAVFALYAGQVSPRQITRRNKPRGKIRKRADIKL
eukprot:jgi/Chrzof1/5952/Cz16g21220.t1